MAMEYFLAYHSYLESMEPLSDAERGRLFTALLEYSRTGIAPELRGGERYTFAALRGNIDRDAAKYNAKCAKNKVSAGKRWDANAYERIRTDANGCQDKDKDKEEDKDKDKDELASKLANTCARELADDEVIDLATTETARMSTLELVAYMRRKREGTI